MKDDDAIPRAPDRRAFLAAAAAMPMARFVPDARPATPDGGWTMPVDRILVEKSRRLMSFFSGDAVAASFRVAVGRGYGPKLHEGDGRTPEGRYALESFRPHSQFYRAIRISYPNADDRARAADLGRSPGGLILLHGLDPGIEAEWRENHWMFNWTRGCIAVTNREMDRIWDSVAVGTPIEIRA